MFLGETLSQTYYEEQWEVESQTGRKDKNGNQVIYKISLTRSGEYQCSCGDYFADAE
jgi:hypothetical protein